jgi:short-subunit dehydrogenase
MRKQRSGVIVNISSLAGYVGFPASSVYNSTKFALEGLSESLSYEIEPYGISVVLIEPGVINTNFAKNIIIPSNYLLSSSSSSHSPSASVSTKYANVVERFLSHYYPAMRNAPEPKEVAKVILESIEASIVSARHGDNNNFHRYPVGDDAKLYADAKRKMSDSELHSFVAERILS